MCVFVGDNLLYDGLEEFAIESPQLQLKSRIEDAQLYNQISAGRQQGVPVLLDFAHKTLENVFTEVIGPTGDTATVFTLLCEKTHHAMITAFPNTIKLGQVTRALRPLFPRDVFDREALDGYFVRLIAVVRRCCQVLVWPLPTPPLSVVDGDAKSASTQQPQPQKEECKLLVQGTEQGGKQEDELVEKNEAKKEGGSDESFVAIVVQKSPPEPLPVPAPVAPLAPPSPPTAEPSQTTATVSPTETPVPPSSGGDGNTPRALFEPISHSAPTLQLPGQAKAEAEAQAPDPIHSPLPITLASTVEPLLKGGVLCKGRFSMLSTIVIELSSAHAQEGLLHMEPVADSIVGVTSDTANFQPTLPLFFQVKRLAQHEDGSECEFFLLGVRVGDVLRSIQRVPVFNQSFSSIKNLIRQEADKGGTLEFVFTRDEGSEALKAVQRAVVTDPSMAGSEQFFSYIASSHGPQGKGSMGAAARPVAAVSSAPRTAPPLSVPITVTVPVSVPVPVPVKSVAPLPQASSDAPTPSMTTTSSSSNFDAVSNQNSGDKPVVIKVLEKLPGSFLVPQLNAPPPNLKKRPAPNSGQAVTKAVSNPAGRRKGEKAKSVVCTAMGNLKPLYRWASVASAAADFEVLAGTVYNAISSGGGIRGLRLRYYDPSLLSSSPPTDELLSLEELRKRMNPKKNGGGANHRNSEDQVEEGDEEDSENASSSSSGDSNYNNNSDDDDGSSRASPPQKRAKPEKPRDADEDEEEEFDMNTGTSGSNPSSPRPAPQNQSSFFAIGTYVNCSQLAGTLKHHAMVLAIRDAGTDNAMAQVGWASDGFKAPSGKNGAEKDWYLMNGKYMELAEDGRGRNRRR